MMNLYDEPTTSIPKNTTQEEIIFIDGDDKSITLNKLIEIARLSAEKSNNLNFYLTFSSDANLSDVWVLFYMFLNSLPNTFKVTIIYRGVLHLQSMGFLNYDKFKKEISQDIIWKIDKSYVYLWLNYLAELHPTKYDVFCNRFKEKIRLHENVVDPLYELKLLGYTFQSY